MLYLGAISFQQEPSWLDQRVLTFLRKMPYNLNIDILVLPCVLVPSSILDIKDDLFQDQILLKLFGSLKLQFYDEKVLARDSVLLWVYGRLKHLEFALRGYSHALVHEVGPVLVVRPVRPTHVHEVRDVSILDVVSFVLQVLKMLSQPGLQIGGDEQVILLMRRGVKVKGRVPFVVHVLVVHEHHLSVPVWMRDRKDVDSVHLFQKLAHI